MHVAQMPYAEPCALSTWRRAAAHLWQLQRPDGHWCAELESNPTVTAEYVFLCQALGLPLQPQAEALSRWLLAQQKEDGSFGVARNSPGDVSTTAEVYLALKILGHAPQAEAMTRACRFVRVSGGLRRVRIFTRIFFALFGLYDWRAIPAMPPEMIFLPRQFPINIYSLASWARGTLVPLFILRHYEPVFALPSGDATFTDELWDDPANKNVAYLPAWKTLWRDGGWKLVFSACDVVLKAYEKVRLQRLRRAALRRCTRWILQRQEPSGDWAGIFPPMLNNLLALAVQGYGLETGPMRRGLEAMERFVLDDDRGRRVQACVSPVWDTLLSVVALCDGAWNRDDARLAAAVHWLEARQICTRHGDWAVTRPKATPGGWSFEYHNTWYPDVDDTAAVILALVKADRRRATLAVVLRAVDWILAMQNRDGGWAAFDADNDKLFLNEAPFADMDALCDPSTADVTGRILEALILVLRCAEASLPIATRRRIELATQAAVAFLRRQQEPSGAFFGRWGVNYLYGTSHVLCGVSQMTTPPSDVVSSAAAWLRRVQNRDGGWGESLASYHDKTLAGRGESTASQTAWALMGLLAHCPATDPSIEAGVAYLVRTINAFGTWDEPQTTATGFPGHFYVRYDLYRHYFPMMALGRYNTARWRLNRSGQTEGHQIGDAQLAGA